MQAYEGISVGIETITPDKAAEYLGHNTGNRSVRPRVVAAYATDMRNGDWRSNGEGIKFGEGGKLLDGQHRLRAIIEADAPVTMPVWRGVEDKAQEVMDTQAKRTYADVLSLRGETSSHTLAAVVRGVAAWERGSRSVHTSTVTFTTPMLDRTLDKYPWLREASGTVNRLNKTVGLPGNTAGALYFALTQVDAEDAQHFFDRLMSDLDHHEGDPIYTLRRKLLAIREDAKGDRNPVYLAAYVIKAWNAYRDGAQMSMIRYSPGGKSPEKFPEAR